MRGFVFKIITFNCLIASRVENAELPLQLEKESHISLQTYISPSFSRSHRSHIENIRGLNLAAVKRTTVQVSNYCYNKAMYKQA